MLFFEICKSLGKKIFFCRQKPKVKGQKHGESTEKVAAGPDERGWRAEKCWTRLEFLVAFLRLLVLYYV